MAVLLAAALVAGGLALVNERRADRQRLRAAEAAALAEERRRDAEAAQTAAEVEREQAQVARLVAESERELDSHLDLALLLAVEAARRGVSSDSSGALFTALTHNMTAERAGPSDVTRTNSAFAGFLAGPPRIQYDVEISDDGRIVAAGGADEGGRGGLTLVFDTSTRRQVGRVVADSPIVEVDVSSDGRHVLTRDLGNSVQLLDVDTGTTALVPDADSGVAWASVFFRPGRDQFVLATAAGVLRLWDVATLAPLDVPLPSSPLGLARFAPDGTLAVGEPTAVGFWDIDRGGEVRRVGLEVPAAAPTEFDLSTDGALLVGADPRGLVHVWDLAKGLLRGDATLRPDSARGIAFSPTSPSILAIGSSGGGVALYDVESERVIGEPLFGHGTGTRDVAFSADGRYLVSIADDGLVGLWGANDGSGPSTVVLDPAASNPSYSSDGRRVALRVAGRIEVRDGRRPARPGVRVRQPPGGWPDTSFQISADGSSVLVFAAAFNMAFVADAATGRPIWVSSPDDFTPQYASLSPDGKVVATVDHSYGRLRSTDVRTGETLAEVSVADAAPDLKPGVSGRPVFSDDGRHLDVPTNLGVARFRAADLRPVVFAAADQNIQGVRDVPGSSDLIGAGVGGQVWRWDMNTGELVVRGRSRDSSSLTNLSVSRDGSMVAAYHPFSAQLALFDAATLRPIGQPFPVGDRWFTPRFTSDGRYLTGNGLFNGLTRWDIDPNAWQSSACLAAGRNLTRAEWMEYLEVEPYRPTCPGWPAAD